MRMMMEKRAEKRMGRSHTQWKMEDDSQPIKMVKYTHAAYPLLAH